MEHRLLKKRKLSSDSESGKPTFMIVEAEINEPPKQKKKSLEDDQISQELIQSEYTLKTKNKKSDFTSKTKSNVKITSPDIQIIQPGENIFKESSLIPSLIGVKDDGNSNYTNLYYTPKQNNKKTSDKKDPQRLGDGQTKYNVNITSSDIQIIQPNDNVLKETSMTPLLKGVRDKRASDKNNNKILPVLKQNTSQLGKNLIYNNILTQNANKRNKNKKPSNRCEKSSLELEKTQRKCEKLLDDLLRSSRKETSFKSKFNSSQPKKKMRKVIKKKGPTITPASSKDMYVTRDNVTKRKIKILQPTIDSSSSSSSSDDLSNYQHPQSDNLSPIMRDHISDSSISLPDLEIEKEKKDKGFWDLSNLDLELPPKPINKVDILQNIAIYRNEIDFISNEPLSTINEECGEDFIKSFDKTEEINQQNAKKDDLSSTLNTTNDTTPIWLDKTLDWLIAFIPHVKENCIKYNCQEKIEEIKQIISKD